MALLLQPALDYVDDQSFATMPNLGVPDSWRVVAIPIGFALIGGVALLQAARAGPLREWRWPLACVAVAAGLLWWARHG